MSRPDAEERFAERVMLALARQERRLPRTALALVVSALVLSVPALAALRARVALEAAVALAIAGAREGVSAMSDNPGFWAGVGVSVLWLCWLSWRALGGRR
jgi:hypothetical protein